MSPQVTVEGDTSAVPPTGRECGNDDLFKHSRGGDVSGAAAPIKTKCRFAYSNQSESGKSWVASRSPLLAPVASHETRNNIKRVLSTAGV